MKNNSAFTLIELLAVIVILAIIALIATPLILDVISEARKGAFQNSAYGIVEAGEMGFAKDMLKGTEGEVTFTYTDGVEQSSVLGKQLDYKGTKPRSGTVVVNSSGQVAIAIHDGTYCAEKTYEENVVSISSKSAEDCNLEGGTETPIVTGEPNEPNILDGMIGITWNGTNWVKADTSDQWYDYDNKQWANAVLLTDAARSAYINADAGYTITEADVLAYLVWIPRYRYKLFNATFQVSSPQEIEIEFQNRTTPKSNGNSNGEWLTHPAFTFGADELDGIWVGKFEISAPTTSDCYTNTQSLYCNDPSIMPRIKPGVKPLHLASAGTHFSIIQNLNDTFYGLEANTDAHMMKNTEWGAVAYLSHSIYGRNNQVSINAFLDSWSATGGGHGNAYITNVSQSTTGNVYGIYDMSGGQDEYVMGAMYNSNNTTVNTALSGFSSAVIDAPNFSKYIDKYTYGTTTTDQTAYDRSILGDATGETRGWYSDYQNFVYPSSNRAWFGRGGNIINGSSAGQFAFRAEDASAAYASTGSSRAVIPGFGQ
jgi:prepilin-type N-terminal cleavage/methylation domain-containing protein